METCGFGTSLATHVDKPISIADLSKSGSGLISGSASNRDADVPRRAAHTHVDENSCSCDLSKATATHSLISLCVVIDMDMLLQLTRPIPQAVSRLSVP